MPIDDLPACRATIRGDTVTLNTWTRGLAGRGPAREGLRHVRAALADLYRDGHELIVAPVRGVPWTPRAEAALLIWAELVGYQRVWLPDDVVDFHDTLAPCGRARVTCPTCHARWTDETVDFWEEVRRDGWFPARCMACGGSLPEWGVVAADADHLPIRVRADRHA